MRMEVGEARERDEPLVDARVVLHRAGAERIEARVDAEVARRQLGEVPDQLELRHLGEPRRLGAPKRLGHLRRGQPLRPRDRRRAAAGLRLLVDQLHRRDLREHVGEAVDLRRRPLLRDGDEQDVVHARVVAPERVPGMHAERARVADDVSRVPSDAYRKLLERCPFWKQQLDAGALLEPLLRIRAERETGLPHVAESLRAEPREVHEAAERKQRLIRRDVGGGLLAADVLLARLQGEDIAAFTRGVYRLADDASRHAADELLARREEAVVRTAVRGEVARPLPLAERDRAAVAARRLEHAERQRIDVRDRQRLRVVRRGGEVRSRLQAAEEVRLLEDHGRRAVGCLPQLVRIGRAAAVRDLDDLETEAGRIGLHHLADLRVRRLGDDDGRAAGRVLRDVARVRGHGLAVVAGRVRDVHPGQLADRGLVLEDGLEHALAHLRLVRRVRREELAALQDRVDHRRHVVVVDACAEERQLVRRVGVPRRQLAQVSGQLLLGQRRLELELAPEPHSGGNVAEQLLDGRNADRAEHLRLVGVGEREVRVGHCSASTCLYAARSSRASTSDGSESRMRISQPAPYGILVHGLRRVDHLLVHVDHLAGERRDQLGDGLDRLHFAVRRVLRHGGARLRRLVVDELPERVDGEPRHAQHRLVALDARPVVLGVVLQVFRVRLSCGHSTLPVVDRLRHDPRRTGIPAHVDGQAGSGLRHRGRHVTHADADVEHRASAIRT